MAKKHQVSPVPNDENTPDMLTDSTKNTAADHGRETDNAPQRQQRRWWREGLCCTSAVIFSGVFALAALLAVPAAQRGAIRLADRLTDNFSLEQVSGSLQEGLRLENLHYAAQGVDVGVGVAELQVDFACLLRFQFCVENLALTQPAVTVETHLLPPSEPSPEDDTPMGKFTLPIGMAVKNIDISDLAVNIDANEITLTQFKSAVSFANESGLTLSPTVIDGLAVKTVATPAETAAANPPANAQTETAEAETDQTLNTQRQSNQTQSNQTQNGTPTDWAAVEQTLTPPLLADLTAIPLPLDFHIQGIEGKNWRYQARTADGKETGNSLHDIDIKRVFLAAETENQTLHLTELSVDGNIGTVHADGQLGLTSDFPLNLQFSADLQPLKADGVPILPASKLDLNAQGSLKKTTALSLRTQGVADAELQLEAQLAAPKTPLNVNLKMKQGSYAFVKGRSPLKIDNADLRLAGDLLNYRATLKGNVEGLGQVPPTKVDLTAAGKLYEIAVEKLNLNALGGSAALSGTVDWKNGVAWDVAANLNEMNIRAYVPTMPAVLSGKLASKGFAGSDGWAVAVPILDLSGTLSQRPISLKGQLDLGQKTLLNVPQLVLHYGNNSLTAEGMITHDNAQTADFKLNIQAPDLRGLLPDLSGAIHGTAHLSGRADSPDIQADLRLSRLAFQDFTLADATLKGHIQTDNQIHGDVQLAAGGLRYGDSVKFGKLTLTATGNETRHQINLQSDGEPVAPTLQISGNFDRTLQRWRGNLSQVNLRSPMGDFRPNQAVAVQYDIAKNQAEIAAHCWQHADAVLCFPQPIIAGKHGEAEFDIRRLNLALVNKLIGQDSLKGQLRSQGKAAWFADKSPQVTLNLNGDGVAFAHKIDYRTFNLTLPQVSLNAALQNNNATLKADINVQNQGNIRADFVLNDIAAERRLGGSLNIDALKLAILKPLFTAQESVGGEVNARLNLGGNVARPLLNGNVDISGIQTKLKTLPFDVTDGRVALRFNGTRSTLQGNIQTADSRLDINGNADWTNMTRWTTSVTAKADRFNVDIPSIAKLRISPDISVQATPDLLKLSGNVAIPWARVTIESLPDSAIGVSEDEVILNGPRKSKEELINRQFAATTQSGMVIQSDLKITIGDDVKLNAYGLKTDLNGMLSLRQDKGKLGLFGQINLKNGRYASFGQDLIIRKGQISFSGLASQPMLDIVAIRNPEAMEDSIITAGVKVTGVPDNPEVNVFSEPSTSQDQALSYLLTGRSLENSGEAGSGGSVGAALLGMGLARSGKLVGGIGEAFGIQDLNLGTAGVGTSSKVVVSGNITNRLQVKYGVGLFDGLAEVTLRYRLLPQLYFQSVSSTNQVFDLLYQFEF